MILIEKVNIKLGNKLKRLRESEGKTQRQLADTMGLGVSTIAMYEIGARVPSDKVKKQYSILFNKSVDEIFFWLKMSLKRTI